MKRYALIALFLGGCMSPVDQFRGAAPAAQAVALNVPAGATASTASVGDGATPELIGQRATFYEITRGVTDVVTWKFDVSKVGTIDYAYVLSAKPRNAADTSYVAIISGQAHVISRVVG